jgi:nitronate monooxygenase
MPSPAHEAMVAEMQRAGRSSPATPPAPSQLRDARAIDGTGAPWIGDLRSRLALPLIVAPMTTVSTLALVSAACRAGVVGAFPATNCESASDMSRWLEAVSEDQQSVPADRRIRPAVNLIVHPSNPALSEQVSRLSCDLVEFVITSVGNPKPVVNELHSRGIRVMADVASLEHAKKALAANVDGLILLSAGAGGHTGWANPFAFVRAVRGFYDGPLVCAGGMSDGWSLWSSVIAGYDLGYMGTKFIATPESGASEAWRAAIVGASLDNVVLGKSPVGIAASLLGEVGSAGHSVSGVTEQLSTSEVVGRTLTEWVEAQRATRIALQNHWPPSFV